MCAEHEATTKTRPRNGIRTRCHDDDLRFETIIASKSTTPAIQSRPTSVPASGVMAGRQLSAMAAEAGRVDTARQ
jgi:hypothetical protein